MKIDNVSPWDHPMALPGVELVAYTSEIDKHQDRALIKRNPASSRWLVCIHGHGSDETQLYTRPDIRNCWLPQFEDYQFNILTVNLRDNAWMSPNAAADLHALLTFLRVDYNAETFVFCSGSMGGTSNLIYAVLYPGDVHAAVARGAATDLVSFHAWCLNQEKPICKEIAQAIETAYQDTPASNPDLFEQHSTLNNAKKLSMPVHLSHGGADIVIPVSQSRRLADVMHGKDSFAYHEIPGGNHDAPLTYTESLDWVMARL